MTQTKQTEGSRLESLFEDARKDSMEPQRVEHVAQRLSQAGLLNGGASWGASSGSAGGQGVVSGKVVLGALFGLVAAGGLTYEAFRSTSAPPATDVAPSQQPEPEVEQSQERKQPTVVETPAREPEAEQTHPTPPLDTTRMRSRQNAKAKREGKMEKVDRDLQLLEEASSALRKNPKKALAMARQHEREFPRSPMAQERAVIILEALSRLGRQGDVGKQSQKFEKEFPDSPHKPRVKNLGNDR